MPGRRSTRLATMSEIHLIARFKIDDGQIEAFQAGAEECKRIVREQDRGTLMYEWFLDAGRSECVVLERYADSGGLLEHIAHVAETLGQLLAISDFSIELFGEPSDELIEASKAFAPTIYAPF